SAVAEFITQDVPQAVVQKGAEASGKLLETLNTQLVAAIQENGMESALNFCSTSAQKLTEEVNISYLGTLSIKRTSLKFRNPMDKPDKFEEMALRLLQKAMAGAGTPPEHLIQKITQNGNIKYRYYKPLLVGTPCLGCHGDEKKMRPELLEKIRKTYPNGTATGYRKGDLRGMVRVEMEAPSATPDI
ncbi:MAG: DUF3365 domain-containing protein, partial [Holophagae bacterium]|nr:DUF3365 domain-containing protein [Holophagae bacterium]